MIALISFHGGWLCWVCVDRYRFVVFNDQLTIFNFILVDPFNGCSTHRSLLVCCCLIGVFHLILIRNLIAVFICTEVCCVFTSYIQSIYLCRFEFFIPADDRTFCVRPVLECIAFTCFCFASLYGSGYWLDFILRIGYSSHIFII